MRAVRRAPNGRPGVRGTVSTLVLALATISAALATVTVSPPRAGAVPPTQGDPGVLPPVDLNSLEEMPVTQWGVTGIGTSYSDVKAFVWDFAETRNNIYVVGNFTGVQEKGGTNPTPIQGQSYIAAFDRDSGKWISTFRPTVNRTVYDIAVAPNGKLIIGGEFTTVNGTPRVGLAMIDPISGALDSTFTAAVTGSQPIVREVLIAGNQVYVAGVFSRITRGGSEYWVYNAARLDASSGAIDSSWVPRFAGGVWDIAIDPSRGRLHAAGSFTSIWAQPGTNRFGTVTLGSGAYVAGLAPYEFNDAAQIDTVAVAYADNKVYVGGAQHITQVLNAATNQRIGFNTTGLSCDQFNFRVCGSFVAGGDTQVLEVAAGGTILAGCHCFDSTNASFVGRTHYSSISGARTDNRILIGYRSSDSKVASSFVPGLTPNKYGTWSTFVDTRGCLYVGGYYTRAENSYWLGGFGRFCQPVAPPTGLTATSNNGSVTLSWTAAATQIPVDYYKVYRNGVWVRDVWGTTTTFTGLPAGSTQKFEIRTRDKSGRSSALVPVSVTVTGATADTQAPTAPGSPTATKEATGVRIRWTASTDNVGVKDYIITNWGNRLAILPATSSDYLHTDLSATSRKYAIFARDAAGNISPGAVATIDLRGAAVAGNDAQAPTAPADLTAARAGDGVQLNWSASNDNVAVKDYIVTNWGNRVTTVPATARAYLHPDLSATSRKYEVFARDGAGNISQGTVARIDLRTATTDTQAPTAPSGLTAAKAADGIQLNWGAASDNVAVKDYILTNWGTKVGTIPFGTNVFTDQNLAAGTRKYELFARDTAGNLSAPAAVKIGV